MMTMMAMIMMMMTMNAMISWNIFGFLGERKNIMHSNGENVNMTSDYECVQEDD